MRKIIQHFREHRNQLVILALFIILCALFGVQSFLGWFTGDRDGEISTPWVVQSLTLGYQFLITSILLILLHEVFQSGINKKNTFLTVTANFLRNNSFDFLAPIFIFIVPLILVRFIIPLKEYTKWYWQLSRDLFKPQTEYYAESILAPLIGKFLGADQSLAAYKLLSLAYNFIWLMVIFLFLRKKDEKALSPLSKTVILALISLNVATQSNFSLTGFPDGLTSIGVALMLLGGNLFTLFVGGLTASLSHFSIAFFALVNISLLKFFCNDAELSSKYKSIGAAVLGVLVGKGILEIWYKVFDYQLFSRISWAVEKGANYWIQFNLHRWDDLIKLQSPFHIILLLIILVALILFKDKLWYAIMLGIGCSFAAYFITIDRPRIFVLIYWPIFLSALIRFYKSQSIPSDMKPYFSILSGAFIIVDLIQRLSS